MQARINPSVVRLLSVISWLAPILLFAGIAVNFYLSLNGFPKDYYPLYWGAQSLLHGDAYNYGFPGSMAESGQGEFPGIYEAGNIYPLPATLLFGLTFSWLPAASAAFAYAIVMLVLIVGAAWWSRSGPWILYWFPLYQSFGMAQFSLTSVLGHLLAWGAYQRRNAWVAAFACLLLSLRPHEGFLIILLICWWFRREVWKILLPSLVIYGAAFLIQPGWVPKWIHYALGRNESLSVAPVAYFWIVIPALILLFAAWRILKGTEQSGMVFSLLGIIQTGLFTWPAPAWYPAASWPVGLPRRAAAGAAVLLILIPASLPSHLAVFAAYTTAVSMYLVYQWWNGRKIQESADVEPALR